MTGTPPSQGVAWVRVARLQFYPMVVIAYGVGVAIVSAGSTGIDWTLCVLGWSCIFLLELATVLSNEYFDYACDVANTNASPFTGGSRMLVDGPLTLPAVRRAVILLLVVFLLAAVTLIASLAPDRRAGVAIWLALGVMLGIGYTAPPLRLSYRGLGELDVAFTHSAYVIVAGYAIQTGTWGHALPWLVSIPSFLAVLCANTLAGIPDRSADDSVNKRSYCVLLGYRSAARIAIAAALAAGASGLALWHSGIVTGKAGMAFAAAAAHALILAGVLAGFIRSGTYDRRIDGIMINALNFIAWFGVIPLIYFATR